MRADLYLGAQTVENSDGAVTGFIHLSHRGLGLGLSNTSYFESVPQTEGMEGPTQIRMDMRALSVLARVLDLGHTEVWLHGGIGESRSTEFARLAGPLLGAAVERELSDALAVEGSARHFRLEHDVNATELRVSLKASVLTVGYRSLQFNVGPPLHGPEAGLTLRF